jgi:hypothetical protein
MTHATPGAHKAAPITYFHNRLKTYDLIPESRQKQKNTIQQILNNNKYCMTLQFGTKPIKEKKQETGRPKEIKMWANFMYVGKETRLITKLFKTSNVKVTFTTINTV